jgi:hypothetical protein
MRVVRYAGGWLAAALALTVLAGCGDDDGPAGPGSNSSGLGFTYDGARSGSYQSDGGAPTIGSDGLPEFGSWSVARPDSLGGLVIVGFQPTGSDKGDVFILQLTETRTGVFEPCGIFAGGGCHGRFFVGVDLTQLASVEEAYEITDGRVEITEITADRLKGTFEATFESQDGTRTIDVTAGVIDVPLSSDPFVGGGIACLARNLEDGTNEPCQ